MSQQQPMVLPSHEHLARLARDCPRSFEALRLELIENFVSRAPADVQPTLRRLQFRIDGIRRLSRSPLGAAIKINALMWSSFFRMNDELQRTARLIRGERSLSESPSEMKSLRGERACVIAFHPRRTSTSLPEGGVITS